MYNKILIRYGELTLKHNNRQSFIDQLAWNVTQIVGTKPEKGFDRMFLPYSEHNLTQLSYVFGISSYSPVIECENDFETIKQASKKLITSEVKTFKIAARRNNKAYFLTSQQLNNLLGEFLLEEFKHLQVDVKAPDLVINVEIRKNNAYLFGKEIRGLGGLPVGISGTTLHLMSGGIDSPVAAFELMKRGLKVKFLSFISPPQTDEKTVNKIERLVQVLTKYQGTSEILFADYSKLLNYIYLTSNESYRINLMRRSFYRIASQIAVKNQIFVLSNGENLGQVASQTLESMATINSQTNLLVLRPLITHDKIETINKAKQIDTYEISIEKSNETCELFAPKKPVTKPKMTQAQELEAELAALPELEAQVVAEGIQISKIC
ncbi:tRNA uracil 4-sulfurtransferase ThiI [Mycoplasmopsis columbinasalis]|uniref:Probable tRNA sulfurtransferase n=1 Tax=Mycoplasmopsis columbinasalis TaxID=114880 RepID=A0A449B9H4_9BACT|nr:tRNA uracil 4-sulfurtransferase ThiI [Mycoplasmopsis columbinasalis]VEU77814.1 thiamine biosynthesis protein ThiI [Mycoplasmopsis columbinasalis]